MQIINREEFESLVKTKNSGVVVVDFFATWCAPCRMLGQMLETVEQNGFKIYKVDVDENQELAVENGAMSLPTLIIFVNGEEKERLVGFKPKQVILDKVNSYLFNRP